MHGEFTLDRVLDLMKEVDGNKFKLKPEYFRTIRAENFAFKLKDVSIKFRDYAVDVVKVKEIDFTGPFMRCELVQLQFFPNQIEQSIL